MDFFGGLQPLNNRMEVQNFRCLFCEESFETSDLFGDHLAQFHLEVRNIGRRCGIDNCKRLFRNPSSLRSHQFRFHRKRNNNHGGFRNNIKNAVRPNDNVDPSVEQEEEDQSQQQVLHQDDDNENTEAGEMEDEENRREQAQVSIKSEDSGDDVSLADDEIVSSDDDTSLGRNEDNDERKNILGRLLLQLKSTTNISEKEMNNVLSTVEILARTFIRKSLYHVEEALLKNASIRLRDYYDIDTEIKNTNCRFNFHDQKMREKYFQTEFGVVSPLGVQIGSNFVNNVSANTCEERLEEEIDDIMLMPIVETQDSFTENTSNSQSYEFPLSEDTSLENVDFSLAKLPGFYQERVDHLSKLIPEPDALSNEFYTDIYLRLYTLMLPKDFCKMVSIIGDILFADGKTAKEDILIMSVLCTRKYPGLKAKDNPPHNLMQNRLKNYIKNKRFRRNKYKRENNVFIVKKTIMRNITKACEDMKNECSKPKKNNQTLKKLLDEVRTTRMEEVKTQTVTNILAKYPALRDVDLLIWEFGKIVDVPTTSMVKNLESNIKKVCETFFKNQEQSEHIVIHFLKNIPLLFKPAVKSGTQKIILMKNSDEISSIREPILVQSDQDTDSLKGYVDAAPFFCEEPAKALLTLTAIYWVFSIKYKKDNHQCTLIDAVIFGNHFQTVYKKFNLNVGIKVNNIIEKACLHS